MAGVGAIVRLWRIRAPENIDVLRKPRLTAGFAYLVAVLFSCYILKECSCRVIADGRTHIKTFSFWSSHPSAMTRCEHLYYALHLDFGRHSFYLDFGLGFDGLQSFARSGNLFCFSNDYYCDFGPDWFSV